MTLLRELQSCVSTVQIIVLAGDGTPKSRIRGVGSLLGFGIFFLKCPTFMS